MSGYAVVEIMLIYYLKNKINQQGRQRELSAKTLRFSLSAEFWKHWELSGRTQRCALPRHQSEEMEI